MYIKQDFIERLKEQAEITDIVGKYADLKREGSVFKCLSPLGNEKTPSFTIWPSSQRFVDYHTDKSGDVISFVMERENLSYPQAIEHLANMVGMPVEYEDAEWAKEKTRQIQKKENLRPLLVAAHRQYIDKLREIRSALFDHQALAEIRKRGYTQHEVTDWGLGYAPGGKFIADQLIQKGQLEAGKELFLVGDKSYDKYWDRVIYPIHDENGLLIGLAGRDVSQPKENEKRQSKTAKWINPADTPLYKKDKTWFALHRAKDAIKKSGEAWILEGYNDVIAWHKHGLENTISSCGTAVTPTQIRVLKRYCTKVVFCFDGDAAGTRATIKLLPIFISSGFQVDIVRLPDSLDGEPQDPDDFVRTFSDSISKHSLAKMMQEPGVRENGFQTLMDYHIQGTELEKASGARVMVRIVASVEDESYQEIYIGWIAKQSGIKETKIRSWFKSSVSEAQDEKETVRRYQLPKDVTVPLNEIIKDIERYQMFIGNNRIWMMQGTERPYTFYAASNFSIEIIQHMQDEKLPMKLVRIRNIHGDERIFDVPSENLNTPQAFDNSMTNHGNFLWTAGRNEFQRLRMYLFDRMGVGEKIEVLGWKEITKNEGFWVWNNAISIPGQGTREIDQNGVFKYHGSGHADPVASAASETSYYIPSANRIYKHNAFKYTPQKKVILMQPKASFSEYVGKMIEVHRSHAISGILFTIASTFLDIIEDKLGNFPLLFLYGPASSGKDQLIDCCQSFYGEPQTPIHIGNKVSTNKAQVRKFAQFRNMIVHLSEYRPGDQQIDELLKGFWDRRGYERGTIDSAYGTETVPIHSSVIFTGNHYPDDDALITRFICEEMTKTEFSLEEKKNYQQLKDMNKLGISGFTAELLNHRALWRDKFKETFRMVESNMKKDLTVASSHDRMISNAAVLGTAYELMKDVLQFPFAWHDFLSHIRTGLESQVRKLNTASVSVKWWDCFLASIRTKTDPLRHGKEFEIQDDKLFFNFTHCYNRVITQWWAQYHELNPSKSKITDMIKKESAFIEEKNSHRMKERKSSVWVIDLNQLAIYDDLYEAVEWQKRENTDMAPAAVPQIPGAKPVNQGSMFNAEGKTNGEEPAEDHPF